MTSELLPEWLNLFLDDIESTLCFVILVVMVMCTAHLAYNQLCDIGVTVYQALMQTSNTDAKSSPFDVVQKIKGMLGIGQSSASRPSGSFAAVSMIDTAIHTPDDEWDYCDKYYD